MLRANQYELESVYIDAEEFESNKEKISSELDQVDGILVPGGFGQRGTEGKIQALSMLVSRRNHSLEYVQMQLAIIEYAEILVVLKMLLLKSFNLVGIPSFIIWKVRVKRAEKVEV